QAPRRAAGGGGRRHDGARGEARGPPPPARAAAGQTPARGAGGDAGAGARRPRGGGGRSGPAPRARRRAARARGAAARARRGGRVGAGDVTAVASAVGGGALPEAEPPSWAVVLGGGRAEAVEARLRAGDPPVVARIADGRLVVDVRTVADDDIDPLATALR